MYLTFPNSQYKVVQYVLTKCVHAGMRKHACACACVRSDHTHTHPCTTLLAFEWT